MRLFTLLLAVAMAFAKPAGAQSTLSQIDTADASRGWEAVGRLNLGETGFCTASMVSQNVVLTAAHCLFYKHDGSRIPMDQIEFQAGLRHGRAEAYRGVRRVVLHPLYDFEGHNQLSRVGHDLAFLELDQPIRMPGIKPFPTQLQIEVGQSVQVVSYAKDREEAPSLERDCAVLTRDADVMVLNCEVDFGASGAPIFVTYGGERRIVSVVSAKAEWQDRRVALAAVLEGELSLLVAAYRNGVTSTASFGSARDTSANGARFIRPDS